MPWREERERERGEREVYGAKEERICSLYIMLRAARSSWCWWRWFSPSSFLQRSFLQTPTYVLRTEILNKSKSTHSVMQQQQPVYDPLAEGASLKAQDQGRALLIQGVAQHVPTFCAFHSLVCPHATPCLCVFNI